MPGSRFKQTNIHLRVLLPHLDQGWLVSDGLCLGNGSAQAVNVGVTVLHVHHVPAEGFVPEKQKVRTTPDW